jgi:HJR/Mrr/RecB family endonuclease
MSDNAQQLLFLLLVFGLFVFACTIWGRIRNDRYKSLQDRHQALINRFYEIARSKVSLRDEYGDENWNALDKEIDALMRKITEREGCAHVYRNWKNRNRKNPVPIPQQYRRLAEFLKLTFMEHYQERREQVIAKPDFSAMTGGQFEAYLMGLLHRLGYTDISGTPTTGDQGADLMASKNGRKIVIQAKNWRGAVGNSAVQEIAAALHFYSGDEGWVVTGSTFTPAARALAQRCSIRLIDGYELNNMIAAAS